MIGAIAGLDIGEAMRGLPTDCDRERTERLFIAAEGAFCAAAMRSLGALRDSNDHA